ncbi:uncharacterized protein LOC110978776 [Acanthaster planci]|uniref:Uncharacterized protein LOC110978776 n=1 Tax=Acanthaster planci TaxID=133434 RepID=A0A8B7YB05_ACAPL|nr:uncharacterized protein LOC110978776 [Acanthaster planci]
MERAILQKRFENNEGKLELDGEDEEKRATFSEEIVWAACDSCEKLRPLLDRIVYRFGTKERDIEEKSMKNQYFPLIDDRTPMEEVPGKLENELKLIFGTDMKKHYSKLVEELLKEQTQPGNDFLRTCRELVNTIKHGDISSVSEILAITKEPVTLARQCTDKIEEICNFFFKAMDKASDLRDQVKQLVSDINEKADELLELLSDNDQFVVTKGSTWKLLEMTALIRRRKRQSRSPDSEAEEALRKLTEGPQVECHNLRRHHQEVEDAVLENHEDDQISAKCRKTCKEAVKALDAGLAEHKSDIGDTETLECLDILGIRKFQLKTKLQKMKIRADKAEELAETITQQEQRFISKENYDFSDVKKFLTTGGGEDKPSKVLDLTRWCTDSTEKILLAMRSCSPRTTSVTNRPKQNRKK